MQASPRLRKNVTSPDAEAGPTPRKDAAMAQRSARSAVPKSPLAGASSSKRKVVIIGTVLTVVAIGAVFAGLFFTGTLNGLLGVARPQSEADKVRVEQSKNLEASSFCALHDGELGLAKLYNLFVRDTIFARATDVEGRIAAGGSINVAQFGVGTKLSGDCSTYRPEFAALGRNDLSNYTIVTDYFQANGIGVKHGGIALVHDEGGNYRVSDVQNGCGIDKYPVNPIDFSEEWSNLVLITQGLAACPDTKSYSARKWAQFFLYVKGEDELEFFNIKESDLTGATEIILVQDPSKGGAPLKSSQTTIIINVIMAGDNKDKKFTIPSMGFTGFDGLENYVLWNFYDYQQISIRRTAWKGTILATEASFEQTSGEIHGTVIARAWNEDQECQVPQSEIHWYPYYGKVFTSDCHPPPPSTRPPTTTPSPTKCPTKSPTNSPTKCPTESPTNSPTNCPTSQPTHCPSHAPTESPTVAPTHCPSHAPTESPTAQPTHCPTAEPTHCPTGTPTSTPAPTKCPTKAPTLQPTNCPTKAPTPCPTKAPTKAPTNCPTKAPTNCPTKAPTLQPTKCPTNAPTTASPTKCPTPPYTNPPTYCDRGCGTETAFAYSCSCRFSTCFLDISNVKNNRWGWSMGPIASPYQEFTANLYAGAASCNPLKGNFVGNVRVSFQGENAIIYVHLSAGVTMSEYHVYFGTTPAPLDPAGSGKYTVAPGQYPYPPSNLQLTSPVSGDYTITYPKATCGGKTVYFIFHAITTGC